MSQSFIISATVFVIIMVIFHIVKDIFLTTYLSSTMRTRVNARWLISTTVGLLILYLVYGCTKDVEVCNKGEPANGVVCAEIYQPVRAPDGTIYPNACYAGRDGWDNSCIVLEPIYD